LAEESARGQTLPVCLEDNSNDNIKANSNNNNNVTIKSPEAKAVVASPPPPPLTPSTTVVSPSLSIQSSGDNFFPFFLLFIAVFNSVSSLLLDCCYLYVGLGNMFYFYSLYVGRQSR
jgi:hypothetical protein